MPNVEYSPLKVDLFFPARSGNFFAGIPNAISPAFCAEMARLAYLRAEPAFAFDREQIAAILEPLGFVTQFFESQDTPDGKGTHCLLAANDAAQLAVVSFRGTDASDPTDIFTDGNILQLDWLKGGKVHAGFDHALQQLQGQLLPAIGRLTYKPVYTGHSLGAAMATLLASLQPPAHLYTIGSPRVGDQAFVDTLAGIPNSRFVDCCDLVTRIPPEAVPGLGTYTHFGDPVYIDMDRAVIPNPTADFILKDRLLAAAEYLLKYGWRSGNAPVRDLADHSPINYVSALKAL